MILLKEINYQNIDKEYNAIINIPEYENGVENPYFSISKKISLMKSYPF